MNIAYLKTLFFIYALLRVVLKSYQSDEKCIPPKKNSYDCSHSGKWVVLRSFSALLSICIKKFFGSSCCGCISKKKCTHSLMVPSQICQFSNRLSAWVLLVLSTWVYLSWGVVWRSLPHILHAPQKIHFKNALSGSWQF